jgi:hypothetical protein
MTISELESKGFYEPGLLHLRINTYKSLENLNELIESDRQLFSTFLHEYIHFLQEVTTTNGLTHAAFYINTIKDFNYKVINDGKDEFEVPINTDNNFNTFSQIELRRIYLGEKPDATYAKYDGFLKETQPIDDQGKILNVPRYKIFYYDEKRQSRTFYFGVTCLKEYAAHYIQSKFFPEIDHPDIPYKIAQLILDKECPSLCANQEYYLALCDACLMSYHPAQIFFNTIERIQKENYSPKSLKEIYDYTLDLHFGTGPKRYTPLQLFKMQQIQVIEHFENALQIEYFSSNLKWIKYILKEAYTLRSNNPLFMIQVLDQDGNLSLTFQKIIEKLGTPYFTNELETGGLVPPKDLPSPPNQPFQLLVFKEILNIYHGNKSCSMHKFCNSPQSNIITDENCKTSPWKRAKDQQLCPLAQLWRTWGLTNEIPVPRRK